MSRISIRSFLAKAKHSLEQTLRSKGEHQTSFVIGNQSADLDSITCALVYGYLKSSTPEARNADRCIIPVTNIPSGDLRLRPELTALLKHAELKPSDLITLDDLGKLHETLPPEKTDWTLVDHNVLQGTLGEHFRDRVTAVIDHHDDEGVVRKDAKPRIIEKTGSCNSHVVNYCSDDWDSISSLPPSSFGAIHSQRESAVNEDDEATDTATWDAEVAKLALGSILIDTVNHQAEHKITEHDHKAAEYLEAKIVASSALGPTYDRNDFFEEINAAKSDLDELSLEDILRKDYKEWTEGKIRLGISSCVRSMDYLKSKEEKFVDALLNFAKSHELQLFAVMPAHNDGDNFARELLLIGLEDGPATQAAEKFVKDNVEELQLEESDPKFDQSGAKWLRFWEQKNLSASRKRVAPMLREAIS